MLYNFLRIFSGGSHLIYGILSLTQPFYIDEFTRFGFSDYRVLIATIQLILGLIMLAGFFKIKLTQVSSVILAAMMAGAVVTRILIKDDFVQSFPALLYMFINSFIFIKSIKSSI
jgi:hypothetical protein